METRPTAISRLLAPLEEVALDERLADNPPVWLTADGWRILARARADDPASVGKGPEIERFRLSTGRTASARWDDQAGVVSVPFQINEAYENYVSEGWQERARVRRLHATHLSAFYRMKRFIPRGLQLTLRRGLIRWQGLPEFPSWPLDVSVARLVSFYARCLLFASAKPELPFRWFWPEQFQAALILTHDVESAEGLRLAVELADLEETLGFRSSFNIVASWYELDHGILRELGARGFELGVHGVYHDRSMFASRDSFDAQQPVLREAAALLGAEGFRSPATHRVYDWLGDLPVSYDCSIPNSDPFEPQPGGCCTVWPFFIGNVVELPYSLPQDHTLFTLLRHRSPSLWITQLERIEKLHGFAEVLTHPDPGYLGDARKRSFYAEFLEVARERPALWRPLPRELARWWRQRDAGAQGEWAISCGTIKPGARMGEAVFENSGRILVEALADHAADDRW